MTDARTGFLQAVHIERIHGKSFIKRIVHADENNDTRGQLFVTFPLPQSQRIQRSLVVPHSPSEIFSLGCLHLDIVDLVFRLHEGIEADAVIGECRANVIFSDDVLDICYRLV